MPGIFLTVILQTKEAVQDTQANRTDIPSEIACFQQVTKGLLPDFADAAAFPADNGVGCGIDAQLGQLGQQFRVCTKCPLFQRVNYQCMGIVMAGKGTLFNGIIESQRF